MVTPNTNGVFLFCKECGQKYWARRKNSFYCVVCKDKKITDHVNKYKYRAKTLSVIE